MSAHLREAWRKVASVQFLDYPDEVVLLVDGERVGHINWTLEQDQRAFGDDFEQALGDHNGYYAKVKMLVVHPEHRRKGYGSMLFDHFVQEATRRFGPKGWDPGEFTPDGAAFWRTYRGEEVRPSQRMTLGARTGAPLWHVTDSPDLVLDPTHQPALYGGGVHEPGLFATPNPELWLYLWRYQMGRPMYAVEVDGPFQEMVVAEDRDQFFVPAEDFDQVTIKRIVPIAQAIAESRARGYGFALLMADAIDISIIHVIDHDQGFGSAQSLCGGAGGGEPIKWTTTEWVRTGPLADRICSYCMDELRTGRIGSRRTASTPDVQAAFQKTAAMSVYRGVVLSKDVKPWNDRPYAVDPSSDDDIFRVMRWDKRGYDTGAWFGEYWTSDKSVAERFAVGTHNLCYLWSFGATPKTGVVGVVIEAIMERDAAAFDNGFTMSGEQTVFGPENPLHVKALLFHVYMLEPVPEGGSIPDYGTFVRTINVPRDRWPEFR